MSKGLLERADGAANVEEKNAAIDTAALIVYRFYANLIDLGIPPDGAAIIVAGIGGELVR